jgi:hypothetical protein
MRYNYLKSMERKPQHSSLALKSGRTGVSLYRRRRRRRRRRGRRRRRRRRGGGGRR